MQEQRFLTLRDAGMEAIVENLGGEQLQALDLPRLRIPAGGVTQWEVDTLEGPESVKTINGVIVYFTPMRAYWSTRFEDGAGAPPDCSSRDGYNGVGNPGGPCQRCRFNAYQTAQNGGKGKACREMRAVFLLPDGAMLPQLVMLPPMSIKPFKAYMMRLASQGQPYWTVETDFGLVQDKNSGGIKYSKAEPKVARQLTPEQRKLLTEYRVGFMRVIQDAVIEVQRADVDANPEYGDDGDDGL